MNEASARQYFETATRHHQNGRLIDAEMAYRASLLIVADQAQCLHQYGVLLSQQGRAREAVQHLEKANRLQPRQPALLNNLGEAYRQANRLIESLHTLEQAMLLARRMPEIHYNLGNTFKQMGRHDSAVAAYETAITLRPEYDRAWFNMANALREMGRTASAIAAYHEAIRLRPDWADAHLNLANAHYDRREMESAITEYRRAAQLNPNDGAIDDSLGNVFFAQGKVAEALEEYRRGGKKSPNNWVRTLRCALLTEPILRDQGHAREFRDQIAAAIEQTPDDAELPIEQLHASGIEPPMILAYHGHDDRPLMQRFAAKYAPKLPVFEAAKRTEKPRVGWVVTPGHEGVFARCMAEAIVRLDKNLINSVVLCSRAGAAVMTHLLGSAELEFALLPDRIDLAAELIRVGDFDLLYYWEVGTDSLNYFLPMLRLAPVQWTGWGWPVSSAIATIDGFLTSQLLEPENAALHYSERLIELPVLPTYYLRPTTNSVNLSKEAFGFAGGDRVYLCQQNLRKYHPDFDAVIAEIIQRDEQAILAVISDEYDHITQLLKTRWQRSIPTELRRIRFLDRLDRSDYLGLVAAADVVLDTPYYGGGANTVLDAVSAGTPIVTWEGPSHRGRWAAAVNRIVGNQGLIAPRFEDVARVAAELVANSTANENSRRSIKESGAELFENKRMVAELENQLVEWIAESRMA